MAASTEQHVKKLIVKSCASVLSATQDNAVKQVSTIVNRHHAKMEAPVPTVNARTLVTVMNRTQELIARLE